MHTHRNAELTPCGRSEIAAVATAFGATAAAANAGESRTTAPRVRRRMTHGGK